MLMCKICTLMLCNLRQYDLHQYSYRLETDAVFKCKYDDCSVGHNNYNIFKSQVYTKHTYSHISRLGVPADSQEIMCKHLYGSHLI